MKVDIFPNSFFFKYKPPNAQEIIDKANSYSEKLVDNSKFHWNYYNNSNCIELKWEDWINLFKPTLNLLSKDINQDFKYTIFNPWLNLYSKGHSQETHDHHGFDFSLLFIVNDGPDFSQFYFLDRNSIALSPNIIALIGYNNLFEPKLLAGDVLIFPSNQLHGVFPHKSDTIRRSIALNFNINF